MLTKVVNLKGGCYMVNKNNDTWTEFMEFSDIYRWLVSHLSNVMSYESKKYGLSFDQFLIMQNIMDNHNKMKNSEIAAQMSVSRSAISRQIRSLREKKILNETIDNNDQRIRYVKLTRHGVDIYERLHNYYLKIYQDLTAQIGQNNLNEMLANNKSLLIALAELTKNNSKNVSL